MRNQSTWTYITNGPNVISLHLNLLNKCIYIDNFYNLVKAKKVTISIPILKHRLAVHANKKHIILGDFKSDLKTCKRPMISKTLIRNSKKLLIATQRCKKE